METDKKPAELRQRGRTIGTLGKAPRNGVHLRLLGPLAATRQGLAIAMPASRKVRALLGYLVLAPRPVLRSHLCELLWDVANDPRSELRWCLTKLRTVIDDARRRRLVSDGQWVSIDASDMEVDAIAFSHSIETAIAEGSVADLQHLTGLIQGDFLEGLAVDRSPMFDNWLRGQRHRFTSWHSKALARLASLLPNDDENALDILRQRIDLVPLDERAHIDLMQALTARGHVAEAEHHLTTTVGLYQREGVDPRALHEARFPACRGRVAATANLRRPDATTAETGRRCIHGDRSDQAVDPPDHLSTRRASIAVMPFEASTPPDQRIADGLTYDITVGLAKLRGPLVIAQGTTFALRDGGFRGPEAATLLGVSYVATGAVRRDGPCLRISLQLCDQVSGHILWADEHQVRGDEAFQVPGTIATRLVSCLESEMQLAESNRAIIKPPNSLDAWEAHHRGLWHMYRFTGPDNDEAQRLFLRAITLDPTFSRPYAGLSFTHWQNAFTFRPTERQAEADRAFDAAGRGMQADPRDPAAHWAMGRALWLRKDDAASLSALEDAVALSPSFAMAHYTRGFVEAQTGDAAAAVVASDFARQLSPFDPMLYAMCCARAFALVRLGRYEEAAEWANRAARKPNAHVQAHGLSALVLAIAGKLEDASREVGIVRRLRPKYTIDDFFSSYRVVGREERRYRIAARRIGIS
jgi:DNA-binding SARP family transcriptional activator/TolB-like protein